MNGMSYREQWEAISAGGGDRRKLLRLARKVANSFMDRYFQNGRYEGRYIDLLCEMGTRFEDAVLNEIASSALFEIIVEQLCDEFEDRHLEIYNRVMAQVVSRCRELAAGRRMDKLLRRFGIGSAEEIVSRASGVQERTVRWEQRRVVKRVYILSRVTIGADVAIVSVLVQRMRDLFGDAEIVILGGEKLRELFACGDVRIQVIDYPRRSGIFERFESWYGVVETVYEESGAPGAGEMLVIDPDSRISQLGVLPVAEPGSYLFLNTRRNEASGELRSMAEVVNQWVDSTFGKSEFRYPRVWVGKEARECGRVLARKMREGGGRGITSMSLGVGGNRRKRLGAEFERRLVLELLSDPKAGIILDQGSGGKEHLACRKLLRTLEERGHSTQEVCFGQWADVTRETRVVAVKSSIGEMAAMIGESDDYVGYDSACQHIAAALGVPCVTVFAGTNNPRFIRRWSAYGDTVTRIVHVNTLSGGRERDYEEVVERVIHERNSNIKRGQIAIEASAVRRMQRGAREGVEVLRETSVE